MKHTHNPFEIARVGECPMCDARLQAQLVWKPSDTIALARVLGWTVFAVTLAVMLL